MSNFQDSYLSGANIEFIEGLYARYLESPSSVDPSWRAVFDAQHGQGKPIFTPPEPASRNGHEKPQAAPLAAAPAAVAVVAAFASALQARVDQTVYAFRLRGHLLAKIDPLGRARAPLDHIADLGMTSEGHFSEAEQEQLVDSCEVFLEKRVKLKDLLARLRRTYCDSVGVEFMNVLDSDRRRWLCRRMEHSQNRTEHQVEQQRELLGKLSAAEGFESFLHNKYIGAKRFSLDGGESLIPMLDNFLELSGEHGVREVLIGMAHRGRLNVLTNILGKSADQVFSEFEGPRDPKTFLARGDVKYHLGFSSDHVTQKGAKIHLSLAFNPSHLEVVNPVVEGRARAKQDRAFELQPSQTTPLLIHGDAAFAGQGLIAETLNLSGLAGYHTAGTVHVVINNQVGFTTDPEDSRSSIYCTQMAQILDIPIFHVNADDPEACVQVMKLATEYRQRFATDVVVDLVCFRRYGHNEADEPAFTQPQMYQLVRAHKTVRALYGARLVEQGRLSAQEVEEIHQQTLQRLQEAHARASKHSQYKEPSFLEGLWSRFKGGADSQVPEVETGVPAEQLKQMLSRLATVPEGFTPNKDIARTVLEPRRQMAQGARLISWAAAESLSLASVLSDGYRLRLTGQDSERGTFSHRHAVLHDSQTGAKLHSFRQFAAHERSCTILNSPLSEMGCLGFEFGYSLDFPDALVIWEAQFGDFANNAQVIIDQFIAAAEQKWRRLSGLTLLLPHGYEGQGPEHSSARLERFLELCAQDNLQVCYPTTPAQIFHLLRRQVLRPLRKPLVVMSPKSMLRRPEVQSPLEQLASGHFLRFIPDLSDAPASRIQRLILCSGKVYYDLVAARDAQKASHIAIARVEQLYPFPAEQIRAYLGKLSKLKEVVWAQEEPKNMGAWHHLFPQLLELSSTLKTPVPVRYVGRMEGASPATGFHKTHEIEQKLLLEEAINAVAQAA